MRGGSGGRGGRGGQIDGCADGRGPIGCIGRGWDQGDVINREHYDIGSHDYNNCKLKRCDHHRFNGGG